MGRRSEHSRTELRQLIINATGELIDTHGVSKVTARMIAEAVEYTPGMLYSVFRNLDDIFLHVNQVSLDELQISCQNAGAMETVPDQAIQAIASAYMDFALDRTHRFELMFAPTKSGNLTPSSELSDKTQALFNLIKNQLTKINPSACDMALEIGTRSLWCSLHGATTSAITNQFITQVWRADRPQVTAMITQYLAGWNQQYKK